MEILPPSKASGGLVNGERAQHTPSQACLKFMNSSYQQEQDFGPSTRSNRVLLVILPEGCAVQHQRAWLMHVLSACPALAKTKYLASDDAVMKVLFF